MGRVDISCFTALSLQFAQSKLQKLREEQTFNTTSPMNFLTGSMAPPRDLPILSIRQPSKSSMRNSSIVKISFCDCSMNCGTRRENIFVYHEIGRMTCMNRTQCLISYTDIEEGCRDNLWVEREVFCTHHWRYHYEVLRTHQLGGHLLHMLQHALIIHCRRVKTMFFLKEIDCGCASVHASLFHDYLFNKGMRELIKE